MQILRSEQRRAFALWLRTGRRFAVQASSDPELKFNPYHDPRDGRFTFAPGGPRSSGRAITSAHSRSVYLDQRSSSSPSAFSSFLRGFRPAVVDEPTDAPAGILNDGVFRPSGTDLLERAQYRSPPRGGIGSNSGAFLDPITLEQTFPGLGNSPSGAIIALADNILDLTGPARETTAALNLQHAKVLVERI